MRSRPKTSGTAKLQALAWLLLGLLAAGYLRLVVVCSGPCCPAHFTLAFAEKACCSSPVEEGGCCGERAPAPARPSCCCSPLTHGDTGDVPAGPAEGERWHPTQPCCVSSPVELAFGPLPHASTAPAVELFELATREPRLARVERLQVAHTPRARYARGEDPPPLARRRDIVTTTLLRI